MASAGINSGEAALEALESLLAMPEHSHFCNLRHEQVDASGDLLPLCKEEVRECRLGCAHNSMHRKLIDCVSIFVEEDILSEEEGAEFMNEINWKEELDILDANALHVANERREGTSTKEEFERKRARVVGQHTELTLRILNFTKRLLAAVEKQTKTA